MTTEFRAAYLAFKAEQERFDRALEFFDQAMADGVNVHGAIAAFSGANDMFALELAKLARVYIEGGHELDGLELGTPKPLNFSRDGWG